MLFPWRMYLPWYRSFHIDQQNLWRPEQFWFILFSYYCGFFNLNFMIFLIFVQEIMFMFNYYYSIVP